MVHIADTFVVGVSNHADVLRRAGYVITQKVDDLRDNRSKAIVVLTINVNSAAITRKPLKKHLQFVGVCVQGCENRFRSHDQG